MIQKVSQISPAGVFKQTDNKTTPNNNRTQPRVKGYADSFVKHSIQSTPGILGITALWSLVDNKTRNIPLKKAFTGNFKNFFIPVILVSSAILALIENKNSKK